MLHLLLASTAIRGDMAALYRMLPPRAVCLWKAPKRKPERFNEENAVSADGQFLIQRNYSPGDFSEIIVYSYSAARKQFSRVQIMNDGTALLATSPEPEDGAWTFTNVPQKLAPQKSSIVLRPTASGWTYRYPGVAGIGECTKE